MYKKYKKDGFSLFINQKNNKKARSTSLRIVLNIYNGEGEIRTLARFDPSTPLAGAPLQPLEYFPKITIILLIITIILRLVKRVTRIELATIAWKAMVLPLNYTRKSVRFLTANKSIIH